jgi:sugar phosphate permease
VNSRRSWIVFVGAVFVYLIGVTQRTTFGVASVDATERFDVTAVAISSVAVVQIIVYAALQIPVGVLADRFGPRLLLAAGAVLVAAGQTLLAFAPGFELALVARILVGAGDAATFISVARLLPNWFEGRILPQLLQWVGMVGQFGQILSAVPFALLLHGLGWTPTFLIAAATSLVAALVAATLVRSGSPPLSTGPIPTDTVLRRLRASIARPGTQLGFWAHLLGGTAPNLMAVLWGYPFLTAGLGFDVGEAAGVMSLMVAGAVLSAPLIGWFVASRPLRRSDLVLGIALLVYGVWAAVLLWPGTPPLWLVAVLFVSIGIGGPGSLIGMDIARSFNPTHAIGSVSGLVNVGGFLGAFVGMFLIGVVLDVVDAARVDAGGASDLYALDSFRLAFLVVFVIAAIGAVGVLVSRHQTRRRMFDEEGIEIAPLWVALYRARRNRRRTERDD